MPTFAEMHTPGGYACGEVASAMQKEIRRGREREAMFWASELDLAGYGNYVWKRLRIIASEDVGLADNDAAVQVRALYENWLDQRKADKGDSLTSSLFLMHAVLILARAPKSRIVDHVLMVNYEGDRAQLEVPDYALDKHTGRGRQMGRGLAHFFEVGAQIEGKALEDPYEREGFEHRSTGREHVHWVAGRPKPREGEQLQQSLTERAKARNERRRARSGR